MEYPAPPCHSWHSRGCPDIKISAISNLIQSHPSPLSWSWAKQSVLLAAHYTCLLFKCACVRPSECVCVARGRYCHCCYCCASSSSFLLRLFFGGRFRRLVCRAKLCIDYASFIFLLLPGLLLLFLLGMEWSWTGAPAVGIFMPEWAISLAQRFCCLRI